MAMAACKRVPLHTAHKAHTYEKKKKNLNGLHRPMKML